MKNKENHLPNWGWTYRNGFLACGLLGTNPLEPPHVLDGTLYLREACPGELLHQLFQVIPITRPE